MQDCPAFAGHRIAGCHAVPIFSRKGIESAPLRCENAARRLP